jgi:hypothetical protein
MITRIRVKSKHIEFQLDGGGYGTMSDETSSTVSVAATPKSSREKNLEAELKREKDPAKRRELKEELDDLKSAREREDARNRAEVADAEEQKKHNIRQRRLEGGSRFNVRYRDRLPDAVLTPTGLQTALAEYVTFASLPVDTFASSSPDGHGAPQDVGAAPAPSTGLPRKGMTSRQVEEQLGNAVGSSERPEGRLRVVTRIYRVGDGLVTAEFVEDVLFRYSVTSN